jgi:hypothetical protein
MSKELVKHSPNRAIEAVIFTPLNGIIVATTVILVFVFWYFWWVWAIVLLGIIALSGSSWIIYNTPEIQALQLAEEQELKAQEIAEQLERWVRTISKKVPTDILEKVESIKKSILEILPQIENINSSDYNIFMIRQIAQSYLPETIDNYLRLPTDFAMKKKLRDSNTPHQLLLEQLDLLDKEMQEMVDSFYHNDTQRLLAHGRFLKNKFGTSDLLDM